MNACNLTAVTFLSCEFKSIPEMSSKADTENSRTVAKAHSAPLRLCLHFLATVLLLLLCALFAPVFLTILLYRRLLSWTVVWLRPDLSHMLRGHGFLFLRSAVHVEPQPNILITIRLGELQLYDFERVKATIGTRLVYAKPVLGQEKMQVTGLVYPELQQFCVRWSGYYFWKQEPDFSLNAHVKRKLLEPGEELHKIQREWVLEPLPECRSPWQVLLVEGPGLGTHVHILFKVHHS